MANSDTKIQLWCAGPIVPTSADPRLRDFLYPARSAAKKEMAPRSNRRSGNLQSQSAGEFLAIVECEVDPLEISQLEHLSENSAVEG